MSIINLLPDDYLERRRQWRANMLCLLLFVLVMAGVFGAAMVSERALGNTQQILDRVNADYQQASKLLQQLQELDNQRGLVLEKAKAAAALQEPVPRSYLLGAVTNALPEGATLLSVELATKRVVARESDKNKKAAKPTRFVAGANKTSNAEVAAPPNVQIDVIGLAGTDVDVARFIANLARCPLTATVDLVYSQEKLLDKVPLREFQVKVELKPNIDVVDFIKQPQAAEVGELARAEG